MATVLRIRGNLIGRKLFIGEPYPMRVRMTEPILRSQNLSGGASANTGGRLQMRTMTFNYGNTGHFVIEFTPKLRETKRSILNVRRVGEGGTIVGRLNIGEGSHRVLTPGKNDQNQVDIYNNSFLPSWINSVEWEGFYESRARRL